MIGSVRLESTRFPPHHHESSFPLSPGLSGAFFVGQARLSNPHTSRATRPKRPGRALPAPRGWSSLRPVAAVRLNGGASAVALPAHQSRACGHANGTSPLPMHGICQHRGDRGLQSSWRPKAGAQDGPKGGRWSPEAARHGSRLDSLIVPLTTGGRETGCQELTPRRQS